MAQLWSWSNLTTSQTAMRRYQRKLQQVPHIHLHSAAKGGAGRRSAVTKDQSLCACSRLQPSQEQSERSQTRLFQAQQQRNPSEDKYIKGTLSFFLFFHYITTILNSSCWRIWRLFAIICFPHCGFQHRTRPKVFYFQIVIYLCIRSSSSQLVWKSCYLELDPLLPWLVVVLVVVWRYVTGATPDSAKTQTVTASRHRRKFQYHIWLRTRTLELKTNLREVWSWIITEKAPTRAFSWLKEATTAFTFKTLHTKQALTHGK